MGDPTAEEMRQHLDAYGKRAGLIDPGEDVVEMLFEELESAYGYAGKGK